MYRCVFKQLCDNAALKNSVGGANEIFGDHLPLNLFPAVIAQCVGLKVMYT